MNTRLRFGAGLAALVVVSGAAVSSATTPAEPEPISACASASLLGLTKPGYLRVVDGADDCGPNERPISWNAAGAPGEPGPPGISGYEIVEREEVVPPGAGMVEIEVACPEGTQPLGGSAFWRGELLSQPRTDAQLMILEGFGVYARGHSELDTENHFVVTAVCAVVATAR